MKTTIHYLLGHFDDRHPKLIDFATTAENNLPKYLPDIGHIITLHDNTVRGVVEDVEFIIDREETTINIYIDGEERQC